LFDERQLVDDLMQMLEREMWSKVGLDQMTYDTRHVERLEQEIEEVRQSKQSALGDDRELMEAKTRVREAITDWVDVFNNWLSRGEEP